MSRSTPSRSSLAAVTLTSALASCGVQVASHDAADSAANADGGNALELHMGGGYNLDLTTDAATCQRRIDNQVVDLGFSQTNGPDAGLNVALSITGTFAGDDDAVPNQPQYFDLTLETPAGITYRYASADAAPAAAGAMTLTKASAFVASGNLQITGLAPAGRSGPPAALHGSFSCRNWD